MAKPKKTATANESLACLLSERYTLTMISDKLLSRGISGASISQLSRVLHETRDASEDLRAALQQLATELCK